MLRFLRRVIPCYPNEPNKARAKDLFLRYQQWNTECRSLLEEILDIARDMQKLQVKSRQQLKTAFDIAMFWHVFAFTLFDNASPDDEELKEIRQDTNRLLRTRNTCEEQIQNIKAESLHLAKKLLVLLHGIEKATRDVATDWEEYRQSYTVNSEIEDLSRLMIKVLTEFRCLKLQSVERWIKLVNENLNGSCNQKCQWRKKPVSFIVDCLVSDVDKCLETLVTHQMIMINMKNEFFPGRGVYRARFGFESKKCNKFNNVK